MHPAPCKVHFPAIFNKDALPAVPTAPIAAPHVNHAQKPSSSIAGKEALPKLSGIELGAGTKYLGNNAKSKAVNRCLEAAKSFGVNIEGPLGTPGFGLPSAPVATPTQGQATSTNDLRPLTPEELKNHMVYLPSLGLLSDVSKTDQSTIDKLAESINIRSQNDRILEGQTTTACMFFKKVLIVKDQICSVVEVEFYMGDDPYIHPDLQIQQSFKFYFRRRLAEHGDDPSRIQPDGTIFTTGPKRGLFIAMGGDSFNCAVLIRSILTPQGVVEGSGEVIDYIMKTFKVSTIEDVNITLAKELVTYNTKAKEGGGPMLTLSRGLFPVEYPFLGLALYDVAERDWPYRGQKIYCGPRVGLDLTEETEYYGKFSMYFMKPWRFTYRGDLLRNAKHFFALTARLREVPDFTIQEDLKVSGELVGRWSSYFTRGETASIDMLMQPGNLNVDDVKKQCLAYGFFSRFNK